MPRNSCLPLAETDDSSPSSSEKLSSSLSEIESSLFYVCPEDNLHSNVKEVYMHHQMIDK